ncbi:hypothetical protein UA08_07877 [Talaromyces atroroseus]|uniref:Fcf2 pre-rRNA processing C-terminal domain-containing protein n=1 Tax=Talaromyces atroroseus TaxID=1441469 RepID=A0A225AIF6_TALAT|nr:hypothetical protein UA08_07877 [Talaromyces atroroseus]OKL56918.1 hypothetical protein UA08_07877 [Talaromyces atroroseus]
MDGGVTHSSTNNSSNDDLIQKLLEEAHARLQSSSSSAENSLAGIDNDTLPADVPRVPSLPAAAGLKPYIHQRNEVASINNAQMTLPSEIYSSEKSSSRGPKPSAKPKEKEDAGNDWFNMPKTIMTPELKRDLQLLRMRNVLDPHRHYKKESGNAVPEYSQVGTIIEGPTEFFKSRVTKKDRKDNFVQEALAVEKESGRFKAKYNQVQVAKTSGKKAHYNRLRAKRRR